MMKSKRTCPVCEDQVLAYSELADGLKARRCPSCHGSWVKGSNYFNWLQAKSRNAGVNSRIDELDPAHGLVAPGPDSDAGKLCLDCGRYMRRVAVGHGIRFHLDRCTFCGGFWFDPNEWAALRASGLHREAHQVFTDAWQAEVRRQTREQMDTQRMTQRLGEEGYTRLEEIKNWIAEHPRGSEILASLTRTAPD